MPAEEPMHRLERLYDETAAAVLGYFRSHRMSDPEGLVGDVFVAAAQRIADFDGDNGDLRRWVFTIAHHRRVDAIRRARVRDAHDPEIGLVHHDPEPADPTLLAALDSLTDEQREVVVLRHMGDMTFPAIAALLGRSADAVKMQHRRALASLQRALAPSDAPCSTPDV